jgi:hypothetical protein
MLAIFSNGKNQITPLNSPVTQNIFSMTSFPCSKFMLDARSSAFELRSAGGQRIWSWIAWAFAIYWILFVTGVIISRKELNSIGGLIVLCVLGWAALERLWVRTDAVFGASLAAAIIPLLHVLISRTPESLEALFKYLSLCLVMAFSRMLKLPLPSSSKMRWLLAAEILGILFISLTIYRGGAWDGGTRHSGLFPNPNNLALIPFLLLFLINRADRPIFRIAAHGVVVLVLAFSGTSGAVLAYGISLAVHLSSRIQRRWRVMVCLLVAIGGLFTATIVAVGGERLLPETRLTNQLAVMRADFEKVARGDDIAYYQQERALGPGSGSAIWRLAHWRRTLQVYAEGTAAQITFGFGPGSSVAILGILPHNEYVRILFEHGFVGFILFIFAWYRMIRTAPAEVRYVGLIFAIYSFSENNLDNFPFMALFILCLSAGSINKAVMRYAKQPAVPTWNASVQQA